jgi:hypothetical protein
MKDLFFDPHVFKHRFDGHVHIPQVFEVEGAREQCHALVQIGLAQFAFFEGVLVIFADGGHPFVKHGLLRVD